MLHKRQIVMLASLSALGPLALDMYLPAAVLMATDLGVTSREATFSVSIFLVGLAAGQVVAGPLSDRIGRRPMILGGLLVFAAASCFAGLTASFPMLLAARLVQAVGACAVINSCRAVVRDSAAHSTAARIFSQMALVSGLAPVLGPLLGAWLTQLGGWRASFQAMAAMGVAMLAGSVTLLAESRSAEVAAHARLEGPLSAYRALLANPRFRAYLIVAGCNSGAFFTYIANSPGLFSDVYRLTPSQYSFLFAANAVALVSASQINRFLLRSRSLDEVLRGSGRNALLLAVGYLAVGLWGTPSLPFLAGLLLLMVGSVAPVQANTIAGGLSTDSLRAGSAAALFGMTSFAVGAAGSWVGGVIYDGSVRPFCLLLVAFHVASHLAIRRLGGEQRIA